uniref:Major facilitator superfamily (MFS) profile domain-containing protein n=1 Tax=Phenylobacterium glaciei TaxID=2803784 RepID=A0A974P1U0_9CAUL|nr:hypothetical protein JKL49_22975 [Phenylobacterium glaciei]
MRGFAVLLCIVPAVGMALNGVAPSELRYASGLFNLMRNLGGAIGIAVVNTWIGDFARTHTLRMSESMADNPEHAGGLISASPPMPRGSRRTPPSRSARPRASWCGSSGARPRPWPSPTSSG